MASGRRPWALYAYALLAYVFLFAPLILVVVNSFNDNPFRTDWRGFTFRWYDEAWSSDLALEAAKNSLMIAAVVAVTSAVLGTAGALALHRARRWSRGFLQGTTYARIVIPELVLALALLIFLVRSGIPRGFAGILIGHTVFCSAYVTVIVSARLAGRDPATEEAARDLGATGFRALWRVTLPEIRPAIVAGSLLAFTFSLDNVVTSFFLQGGTTTLPLVIFGLIRFEVSPVVNALGTTLMAVTAILMVLFLIVSWRWTLGAERRARGPGG
jgi:spermidine/putrescine transport system permease protein